MNRTIQTFLNSIIDYAGLFPPAGLDMATAVANYADYRSSDQAWMLGRFIVPANRLDEFEIAFRERSHDSVRQEAAWKISALMGPDIESELATMGNFNRRIAGRPVTLSASCVVDAIELKAGRIEEITQSMRVVPQELVAYFEVAVSSEESLLSAIRSAGARAKIRTGGVTSQAFPACSDLAGFLARAASVGMPFKATAGLHHPVRSEHRLTYAEDSPRGTMHGFLNVFLAAAGVHAGMSVRDAERLLDEQSPGEIRFDEHGVSWRQYRWTSDELLVTRSEFAISFGSCSFLEPIDDLKAMRLL